MWVYMMYRKSYIEGFQDALLLLKHKLDPERHKDVIEMINYYLNLVVEKKIEQIMYELEALR